MALGMPAAMPETSSPSAEPAKKPAQPPPSDPPAIAPPPPSTLSLSNLVDTWDEVRDAIQETELAQTLSEQFSRASRFSEKAWAFSRSAAWIFGTSALVLIVPLLYEIDKEVGPGFDPAVNPSPTSTDGSSTQSVAGSGATEGSSTQSAAGSSPNTSGKSPS